ncbi:hypothetical protein LR48_Vigan05g017700 [Vigna angularis]|uniref:Uncharacterized protein n=1 Tax=Phaseolus angularis TaxID=3914 RepID=A0A0L9UIJ7_PHAAN|nr:hypothetical protein LR48_Vigan05g017700 [Vigna angularis]
MHFLPSFSGSVPPKASHKKQIGRSNRMRKKLVVFMVVGIAMESEEKNGEKSDIKGGRREEGSREDFKVSATCSPNTESVNLAIICGHREPPESPSRLCLRGTCLFGHHCAFLPQRRVGRLRRCLRYRQDVGHMKRLRFEGVQSPLRAHRPPSVVPRRPPNRCLWRRPTIFSKLLCAYWLADSEEMMPKPKEEQEVRKVVIRKESFGDSELEGLEQFCSWTQSDNSVLLNESFYEENDVERQNCCLTPLFMKGLVLSSRIMLPSATFYKKLGVGCHL